MIDPVAADLVARVTKLEVANEVNFSQLVQRINKIESDLERLMAIQESARRATEEAARNAEIEHLKSKLAAAEAAHSK